MRKLFGVVSERSLKLLFLANAVRVSEKQLSRVWVVYQECCEILDMEPPALFVAQNPVVNAGAMGMDEPFIVLNSGTLDLLEDEELRFVIGHELGHILSGHALYKTMIRLMLNMALFRLGLPVASLAIWGVLMALKEWDRKSELSADRAGLLCLQDPWLAYQIHMKTAGGRRLDEMSVEEFIKQAEDYEQEGDLRDGALKLLNLLHQSHPSSVLRLAELKHWVDSGHYEKILSGEYSRRGDEGEIYKDITESVEEFKERLAESSDPLFRFFGDLGESVSDASAALRNQFKDFFQKAEDLVKDKEEGED